VFVEAPIRSFRSHSVPTLSGVISGQCLREPTPIVDIMEQRTSVELVWDLEPPTGAKGRRAGVYMLRLAVYKCKSVCGLFSTCNVNEIWCCRQIVTT